MLTESRPSLQKVKRIIIKIGSRVIASSRFGVNEKKIAEIASAVALLQGGGKTVSIVSSGAIVCGMETLRFKQAAGSLAMKQAAAAVGQSRLMWAYENAFAPFQIKVAQILLTQEDVTHPKRNANARHTLETLLAHRIVPIINENDTVTVDEIKFGDNDQLAAQIIPLLSPSLLIILSNVDGLYSADPRTDRNATFIPYVSCITSDIWQYADGRGHAGGTGGMASKVKAATLAAQYGVPTLVINGTQKGLAQLIDQAIKGQAIGTLFWANTER